MPSKLESLEFSTCLKWNLEVTIKRLRLIYVFTCVTVVSKRVFDENLFWLFVSCLFSIFIKTKVPVLQTNLIVLERILVVSKIVTKPNTLYMKIFKHLIHFLYLMRPILMIISSCDKTESDKKSYWELISIFFRLATANQQSNKWNRTIWLVELNNNKRNIYRSYQSKFSWGWQISNLAVQTKNWYIIKTTHLLWFNTTYK